jgi:hypothetical protein
MAGLQVRGQQPNAQLPDFQQQAADLTMPDGTPGYQLTGLPTAIDPIQEMLGAKSLFPGLSNVERDAMLYALLNREVKSATVLEERPDIYSELLSLFGGVPNG